MFKVPGSHVARPASVRPREVRARDSGATQHASRSRSGGCSSLMEARPKCAVFGIVGSPGSAADPCSAAQFTYFGLSAQQHRGQESAGILSMDNHDRKHKGAESASGNAATGITASYRGMKKRYSKVTTWQSLPSLKGFHKRVEGSIPRPATHLHKDFGLVTDVFTRETLTEKLRGNVAIGHTRYSTAGSEKSPANIQPFLVKYRNGSIGLVHNGDISNFRKIQAEFVKAGTLFHSTSDSELILHLISRSQKASQPEQVLEALSVLEGAFSMLIMTEKYFFAVRDPNGFRPLHLGVVAPTPADAEAPATDAKGEIPGGRNTKVADSKTNGGDTAEAALGTASATTLQGGSPSFVFASETCAFDLIGAKLIREVEPGEVLCIDLANCQDIKQFKSYRLERKFGISPCIFEFVYFSRADSQIFGSYVDTVRANCGAQLAREAPVPKKNNVVVVPVPQSANTAALAYAEECKRMGFECRFDMGLVRNNYVGRTFITPGQGNRMIKVRRKFGISRRVVQGAVVVLVDDSIVRGTTSSRLIQMIKDSGAKEVHFRAASPPVRNPCYFGMDFPNPRELIANRAKNVKGIQEIIRSDSLAYLSWDGLKRAVMASKPNYKTWCGACFTGEYPVPIPQKLDKSFEW